MGKEWNGIGRFFHSFCKFFKSCINSSLGTGRFRRMNEKRKPMKQKDKLSDMKKIFTLLILFSFFRLGAFEREPVWPAGKMPDANGRQIAVMVNELRTPGFNPDDHREPYLEWFETPDASVRNGACMILISGGAYNATVDVTLIEEWRTALTAAGVQCVNFVYRTPRPQGIPYYQTAWEDGQRAVRPLIWPALRATAMSAMVASSVSPERWDTMAV